MKILKLLAVMTALILSGFCGAQTITTSTSATTPATLDAGSYVRVTLAPGPNTLTIDVAGTYTGQLALRTSYQGNLGVLRAWPSSSIANCLSPGASGIAANATGTWTTTVPGPGYAYVVATSLASGTPTVTLSAGNGTANLAGSVASATGISAAPLPWQYVFTDLSGAGSTINVEVYDAFGVTQPLTTAGGTRYGAVTITVPANSSLSLGYGILTATSVSGSSVTIAALPATAVGARITLKTGSCAMNTSGTTDGAIGAGGGVVSTLAAPNASSPSLLLIGDIWVLGRR